MHLPTPLQTSLLTLLTFLLLSTSASAAFLTFAISPTHLLPNPSTLPPSTQATLFRLGNILSVPITRRNTFDFKNVTEGSYLLTVQCRDYTFPPLRVDVFTPGTGAGSGSVVGAEMAGGEESVVSAPTTTPTPNANVNANADVAQEVGVWQTFWGNEWSNKGEKRGGGLVVSGREDTPVVVEVRPESAKEYYAVRASFSALSLLRNPMILMAIFSLVLIVGLPYLMDNMDEETKAEFEEMQKNSSLRQASNTSQNLQNFDLAGWMAEKK